MDTNTNVKLTNVRLSFPSLFSARKFAPTDAKGSFSAALILDKPERAWLAPELGDMQRELALATLLALRLIPLGFD